MRSFFGHGKSDADSGKGKDKSGGSGITTPPAEALPPAFKMPSESSSGPLQEIPELTESEKAVFAQIKQCVPELIKDLPPVSEDCKRHIDESIPLDIEGWLTDACIARYVRARKGVYEDTRKALRKTIEWRATTRPHALRPDAVELESRTGKMYFNGYDRFSRPVIYMYNERQNTKEADGQIRWVIYTLELCIRHMRPGVEKVTLAINASQWGFSNTVAVGTAKKFLDVLANHYPERLGRAVVFKPPRFFVAFYSLVSPFIDPVTKAKVAFINPDSRSSDGAGDHGNSPWISIEDCFDADKLESDCYGEWPFSYNHQAYWLAIESEFSEFKASALSS